MFAHDAHRERIAETTAAQGFPANLTNAGVDGVGVSRIVLSAHCLVIAISVARALVPAHQHFLKRDTVFFNVLVYSE
jgi:hypothetical protein